VKSSPGSSSTRRAEQARVLVRGIRAVTDFEAELDMAHEQKDGAGSVVYLMASLDTFTSFSHRIARCRTRLTSTACASHVLAALEKKFGQSNGLDGCTALINRLEEIVADARPFDQQRSRRQPQQLLDLVDRMRVPSPARSTTREVIDERDGGPPGELRAAGSRQAYEELGAGWLDRDRPARQVPEIVLGAEERVRPAGRQNRPPRRALHGRRARGRCLRPAELRKLEDQLESFINTVLWRWRP
jgi:hypothetical protein